MGWCFFLLKPLLPTQTNLIWSVLWEYEHLKNICAIFFFFNSFFWADESQLKEYNDSEHAQKVPVVSVLSSVNYCHPAFVSAPFIKLHMCMIVRSIYFNINWSLFILAIVTLRLISYQAGALYFRNGQTSLSGKMSMTVIIVSVTLRYKVLGLEWCAFPPIRYLWFFEVTFQIKLWFSTFCNFWLAFFLTMWKKIWHLNYFATQLMSKSKIKDLNLKKRKEKNC